MVSSDSAIKIFMLGTTTAIISLTLLVAIEEYRLHQVQEIFTEQKKTNNLVTEILTSHTDQLDVLEKQTLLNLPQKQTRSSIIGQMIEPRLQMRDAFDTSGTPYYEMDFINNTGDSYCWFHDSYTGKFYHYFCGKSYNGESLLK